MPPATRIRFLSSLLPAPALLLQVAMAAPVLAGSQNASPLQGPITERPGGSAGSQTSERGAIAFDGHLTPYLIRSLPISSFPDLPAAVATELNARGCTVPQTFEAHRPENVIHGSLEHAGSADWAVLCSHADQVSLLVFFASRPATQPFQISTFPRLKRLELERPGGTLGFDWGIDPASPARVHQAQSAMSHRPPAPDHDSIADSTLEQKTIYRAYRNGDWQVLETE